ncbi:DUF2163 domain-containing protein [Alphaproteobacteria bacterium GH1-50]|uniref:DUF2163 domain-containing protein n=1 Tax=Kangsaoukella pontilimi TaxID=2691042 RepID=A0A7C9MWH6_9RHOB|nr:DUF2163 domain-containing protein [Kangsaoukella pontilimi]MXQ07634.1 DUF2163 domain-containing protein [Kangsaoukella pontilimi]
MSAAALAAHLATGTTTVARAWLVRRRDGRELGFTDHDRDLSFAGVVFSASAGLSARAVEQTTGLAVDNSEAVGVLSDPAISEGDIRAGLFDGAEVELWLVNWADTSARRRIFRGNLGEIERSGASFRCELRGLSDRLNRPIGRSYQKRCGAVLGDRACGVDIGAPEVSVALPVVRIERGSELWLAGGEAYSEGWFSRGRVSVETGAGVGASGSVKRDRLIAGQRVVELWSFLSAGLQPGDTLRLVAGCDKRAETCREKFDNFLNFRGFPDIPGEDWLMSYPVSADRNDGGTRRS